MKKFFKVLFIIVLIGGLIFGGYYVYTNYIAAGSKRTALSVIPPDAIFIIETDNLTEAWTNLSNSSLWKYLMNTSYFADINADIVYVDKYLKSNTIADQLLSGRALIVSSHMKSANDWDFIYAVDLQGAYKSFDKLKDAISLIDGYRLESREFKADGDLFPSQILSVIDENDPTATIYLALVDNILVVSFTEILIENVLLKKDIDNWKNNRKFQTVTAGMSDRKMFKFYFNYEMLNTFSRSFLTQEEETITMLGNSLAFSAFEIDLVKERLIFDGYTNLDSMNSYIRALVNVSPGKIRAFDILSNQTAAYISIGFDNYLRFYDNLMKEYEAGNPNEAQDMRDGIDLVQKLFSIDLKQDFFSWIGTEIALCKLVPKSDKTREEEVIIAINAKNIDQAKSGMNHITSQIRKRSPLKFEVEAYRNFEINYLDRKGFFKLFFGKLFDKLEKPFFTYIEDYVIFSNSPDLIKEIIDDYITGNTLSHNSKFTSFKDDFETKSNLAIFLQMPKMYATLLHYSTAENKKGIVENKELILSFARLGFQLSGDGEMFKCKLLAEYDDATSMDEALQKIENSAKDDLFSKQLDSMAFKIILPETGIPANGIHKINFQGTDRVQSEGNVTNGKPEGIWRSYYESGNLYAAVNYKNGLINGIAYFYYDKPEQVKQAEVTFADDKIIDDYKEFYDNGARKAKIHYDDGLMDGAAEFYFESGNLKISGEYKKGTKSGKWAFYNENGEVISKEKWKKGNLK